MRFTIIDPVGLGQNFAAFMHLADYDEPLVTSRIWTEPSHIEQRLADLTEHMENVIQKYLRNEFADDRGVQRQAGEVAEPFRVLVVANFPANFTEAAARRLVSIAASGARCGVYTLISVDTKQPLPRELRPGRPGAARRRRSPGTASSASSGRTTTCERFPLALDAPPDDEQFTAHRPTPSASSAKDASRVEVPFEFIAPPPEQWWTADSRSGIDVPLGRAGATKLQYLRLGKGTSQHVLIAGKTGSGKSTLLHALITNLALHVQPRRGRVLPDRLQEGRRVQDLRRARAAARPRDRHRERARVRPERAAAARRRAEAPRRPVPRAGVQDLAGYRDANGRRADAADPADRRRVPGVLRRGRQASRRTRRCCSTAWCGRAGRSAFTCCSARRRSAGPIRWPAARIGQMAVRIALQCSEADAHLILSEDNTAARLLSRPGEAIYNDANGLVEGNNPFQVVWLSDERREEYLRADRASWLDERGLAAAARRSSSKATPRPRSAKNHAARRAAGRADAGRLARVAPLAWLGEPIAIKDPTAAVFRPQSGNNLLIVGQHDEAALAMMASSLVSLAAQHSPDENGPRRRGSAFSTAARPMPATSATWSGWPRLLPHDVQYGTLARRRADRGSCTTRSSAASNRPAPGDPALLLLRLRPAPLPRPAQGRRRLRLLARAIGASQRRQAVRHDPPRRSGAGHPHDRLVRRAQQRCSARWSGNRSASSRRCVLFQMSPADSSQLIDTPAASKLGPHRALLYREEQAAWKSSAPTACPAKTGCRAFCSGWHPQNCQNSPGLHHQWESTAMLRERFWRDAPKAWQEYDTLTRAIQGRFTTAQIDRRSSLALKRSESEFRQREEHSRIVHQFLGPEQVGGVALVRNAKYAFKLRRHDAESPWVIKNLLLADHGVSGEALADLTGCVISTVCDPVRCRQDRRRTFVGDF